MGWNLYLKWVLANDVMYLVFDQAAQRIEGGGGNRSEPLLTRGKDKSRIISVSKCLVGVE